MNWINQFARDQTLSAIGIAVILFFIGITIAAKADSKWGYVVSLAAVLFVVYILKVVLNLF